jgi:hypothetical protein
LDTWTPHKELTILFLDLRVIIPYLGISDDRCVLATLAVLHRQRLHRLILHVIFF